MQVRNRAIAGALEPLHASDEQIAAQPLRGVFGNQAPKHTALLQDVIPVPAPAAGIAERERLAEVVGIDPGERVGNAPAAGELEEQEIAVALERNLGDREALAFGALDSVDRLPDGRAPESLDVGMSAEPGF